MLEKNFPRNDRRWKEQKAVIAWEPSHLNGCQDLGVILCHISLKLSLGFCCQHPWSLALGSVACFMRTSDYYQQKGRGCVELKPWLLEYSVQRSLCMLEPISMLKQSLCLLMSLSPLENWSWQAGCWLVLRKSGGRLPCLLINNRRFCISYLQDASDLEVLLLQRSSSSWNKLLLNYYRSLERNKKQRNRNNTGNKLVPGQEYIFCCWNWL